MTDTLAPDPGGTSARRVYRSRTKDWRARNSPRRAPEPEIRKTHVFRPVFADFADAMGARAERLSDVSVGFDASVDK